MIIQLEPARAKAKKPDKYWNDEDWISEEKLDGWRFLMHVGTELDRTYLTGRRTSVVTGELSEKADLVPTLWPHWPWKYTVIDGEVIPPPGAGFRDLASMLNATPDVAAKNIARLGSPRFVAFDVLYAYGADTRDECLITRRSILEELVDKMGHSYISVVKRRHEDKENHYREIIAQGGEGVILKNWFAPYGEDWIKVKRVHHLDVVITGFTEAKMGRTGKYLGQIGAALVSVYTTNGTLVEVGKVSGMDDATRLDMTANPDQWIGSVIEIACQGWGRDRLRHPRFKRRREDAAPEHATFAKLMDELKLVAGEQRRGQLQLL